MRDKNTSARVRLFVYGTLTDDGLVFELTGRRFQTEPGVLPGYRKIVPTVGYPYIVADANGTVDGLMLRDVDTEALGRFDSYEDEGRLYRRTEVAVTVAGGQELAMTYVGIPEALTQF